MKCLLAKRTFRSKMLVGVGALLTKKKLKCQTCGEYNDTGSAKPFTGPEARKWRKVWEKEQQQKSAAQIAAEERAADSAARALIAEVARAQASGLSFDEEGNELQAGLTQAAPATPQPSAPIVPAGWHPDPTGRYQLRYWDGASWTAHVSIQGVQGSDPM